MTGQLDMFCAAPASFPPYLDPDKVDAVLVDYDVDRDHIGAEEIGRLGNNKEICLVIVRGRDGSTLHQETFSGRGMEAQANTRRNEILVKLNRNRQRSLFSSVQFLKNKGIPSAYYNCGRMD